MSRRDINIFGFFTSMMGPVQLAFTALTGRGAHHMDLSLGWGGIYEKADLGRGIVPILSSSPTIDIGYRYQKPEGGFLFRAYIANFGFGIGVGGSF